MTKEHILEVHNQIVFDEIPHKYYFEGEEKISATTFIKQFHEEFDREKVLDKKGLQGLDRINEKDNYRLSGPKGSTIHECLEFIAINLVDSMLNCMNKYVNSIKLEYRNQIEKGCILVDNWLNQGYEIVGTEVRVTDGIIAGTMDLLLYNPKTGKYVILDYKTCDKLGKNNYGSMFNEPFKEIECSKHSKYSMQLSLYAAILEDNYEVEIEGMYLLWIPKEQDEFEWACEDLRDVIRRVL